MKLFELVGNDCEKNLPDAAIVISAHKTIDVTEFLWGLFEILLRENIYKKITLIISFFLKSSAPLNFSKNTIFPSVLPISSG